MRKSLKIAGFIAAGLLLLVIVLAVVVRLMVTPERVRAVVLPRVEQALQRPVVLQDLSIGLRSIALEGLTIGERDGAEEHFVAAERMVLRFRLLPLLRRQVIIHEVRLDGPQIRVVRLADGTFNFSDLLEREQAEEVAPPEAEEGAPIDLLVSEFIVTRGELVFIDHALGGDAPYRQQLAGVELQARDISLTEDFPFRLRALVNGSALETSGQANAATGQGNVRLTLQETDLAPFFPYLRESFPGRLEGARASLELNAAGGAEGVRSQGEIRLREISAVLQALPEARLRRAFLTLAYDLQADPAGGVLTLDALRVDANGIPLQIAGRVTGPDTEPQLDLRLTLPEIDLRQVMAAVPPALVEPAAGLQPAGVIGAMLHLAGSPQQPPQQLLRTGEVRLRGVQANLGPLRPALEGLLKLQGDSISSQGLVLRLGDDRAEIELQAKNLFGEIIDVSHRVRAERLDLDALLQSPAAPTAEPAPAPPAEEIGPFALPLRVNGVVQAGRILYRGLPLENFEMRYRLEKNVLTVEKMTARAAGGTFNQTARVDLGRKGLAYASQLEFTGAQADPVLSALMPSLRGTVFGALNLKGQLSGEGTTTERLRRNLSAKGDVQMSEGHLAGPGLVQGLAQFLNAEELRKLQFNAFGGSFTIQEGKVRIDSEFAGAGVRMQPQGVIGLDGSLDLALNSRFSPELSRRIKPPEQLARLLLDEEGWSRLPIRVAGDLQSPRFVIDSKAVGEELKEKGRQELQRRLEEKILPKLPGGEADPPQDSPQKRLEDAVRGLLKR